MASTSVHFPKGFLAELDRAASEAGVSRNRLVIEACRSFLDSRRRAWPDGFFDDGHLSADQLAELKRDADGFSAAIEAARASRVEAPF